MVGDLKSRPIEWPKNVLYRQGDLNDLTVTELASFEPDVFIHLAATFERTFESRDFWGPNFQNNVLLSHRLMTVFQRVKSLRRVVFASSYLIYDPSLYLFNDAQNDARSLAELDPIRPRNLTGMAKLAHEQELEFITSFEETPFSAVSARIFRGYGLGSQCVISRWIRSLLAGEAIRVYRDEGIFDYIFARDSAEGLARLAATGNTPKVVNLGTGIATRVADVVSILRERFPNTEVIHNRSDLEFEASCADTTRLAATLDWVPSMPLEDGIDLIIKYEQSAVGSRVEPSGGLLVTSASAKVPLIRACEAVVSNCWSEGFVVAGDANSNALTAFAAECFWTMPQIADATPEAMISDLVDQGIRFVIPTRDGELAFFADNREAFTNAGIHVMVSSPDTVDLCRDKLRFAMYCRASGLPTIDTAETVQDVPEATKRFVVKERYGSGAHSIGLNLAAGEAARWGESLDSPIFQPHVHGSEYSIDVYRSLCGEVVRSVVRSRDLVIDGESKVSTILHDEEISDVAHRLANVLDIRGHAVVQVLRSHAGLKIVECNPRVGGASTLAFAAGLRSIDWFVAESLGIPSGAATFHQAPHLRLVCIPTDTFR